MTSEVPYTDVRCSFCGRHNKEAHMVGRDDLRICSVCVANAGAALDIDARVNGPAIDWPMRWRLKSGIDDLGER